jgi:phosphoribosyl 1,2-cyclic phosphodiesterase
MLKLKCLATGSSGNCYLLSTENETLILDCGIPIKDIKKGLDFDLSKVVGCVVTHSHKDHSQSAWDLKKSGIFTWEPYREEQKIKRQYLGGFEIRCFDVPHDDTECRGFLIKFPNQDMLLYVTDFEYIKYSFKKMRIQHLLIECNYQNKYVEKSASNREHVLRGHAELNTTLGVVKDNADSLKNVVLCHISHGNGNPYGMVEEVQKCVKNANVYFAEKGKEFSLTDECPF